MSSLERKIIAIAMLLTLVWGGALFIVFMMSDSGGPPPQAALLSPDSVRADVPVKGDGKAPPAPAPAPQATGALAFPAAAAITLAETDQTARRAQLASVRSHLTQQQRMTRQFNGRYEDRTGTILAPTTAPGASATLVTVHLTKATARQALVALANAAKIKIAISAPGWLDSDLPSININADAQPMMEVFNEICCKMGGSTYDPSAGMWWDAPMPPDPSIPVLRMQNQLPDVGFGPWVISGPFSFEAQRVFHASSTQIDPKPQTASVTLKVTHEPAVIVMALSQQPTLTQALDDQGHSLIPDPANAVVAKPRQLSWAQVLARAVGATQPADAPAELWASQDNGLTVQLQCPPDFGHQITKLAGTERILVQQTASRFELPLASPPIDQSKTIDGISITVDNWQVFPQQKMFRLNIHRTNQDQVQWNRIVASVAALNPVLLDANGVPLPAMRSQGSNGTDTDCFCQFMCFEQYYGNGLQQVKNPAKLVVDLPSSFKTLDVPFYFSDLPLP